MELQSAEINEIALALCKAQSTMGAARKDSQNPFFKSKYADLTACIEAVREPFMENDLCFYQGTLPGANGSIQIITTIAHKSGQWIRGILEIPPVKKDPQATGSAISYGKRYGLQALAGLPTSDDDGEKAMNRNAPKQKAPANDHQWQGNQKAKYVSLLQSVGMDLDNGKDLIEFYLANTGQTKMTQEQVAYLVDNFNHVVGEFKAYLDND